MGSRPQHDVLAVQRDQPGAATQRGTIGLPVPIVEPYRSCAKHHLGELRGVELGRLDVEADQPRPQVVAVHARHHPLAVSHLQPIGGRGQARAVVRERRQLQLAAVRLHGDRLT